MREQLLTVAEVRIALRQSVGQKCPMHISKKNHQVVIGYIRGFADTQCNIVLVSEQSDSETMRIVDLGNIASIECSWFTNWGLTSNLIKIKKQ